MKYITIDNVQIDILKNNIVLYLYGTCRVAAKETITSVSCNNSGSSFDIYWTRYHIGIQCKE